jgi:hypothetical protein
MLISQNGGSHLAWNHIWLSSSLLDLLESPTPLVRVPKEMLVYCAARHFISDLPMGITRGNLEKIWKRFAEVKAEVEEAEVRFSYQRRLWRRRYTRLWMIF